MIDFVKFSVAVILNNSYLKYIIYTLNGRPAPDTSNLMRVCLAKIIVNITHILIKAKGFLWS